MRRYCINKTRRFYKFGSKNKSDLKHDNRNQKLSRKIVRWSEKTTHKVEQKEMDYREKI